MRTIDIIREFVALQMELVDSFHRKHPQLRDDRWLLDYPATGELMCRGKLWRFDKHGAGLRFTLQDPQAIIVDVHREVNIRSNLIAGDWVPTSSRSRRH